MYKIVKITLLFMFLAALSTSMAACNMVEDNSPPDPTEIPKPPISEVDSQDLDRASSCIGCTDTKAQAQIAPYLFKRVHWVGYVFVNSADGLVVKIPGNRPGGRLVAELQGVPISIRNSLRSGDPIEFEATIYASRNSNGYTVTLGDAEYFPPMSPEEYGVTITDVSYRFERTLGEYALDVSIDNATNSSRNVGIRVQSVTRYKGFGGRELIGGFERYPKEADAMTIVQPGKAQVTVYAKSDKKLSEDDFLDIYNGHILQVCVWVNPVDQDGSIDPDEEISSWKLDPNTGCFAFQHQ